MENRTFKTDHAVNLILSLLALTTEIDQEINTTRGNDTKHSRVKRYFSDDEWGDFTDVDSGEVHIKHLVKHKHFATNQEVYLDKLLHCHHCCPLHMQESAKHVLLTFWCHYRNRNRNRN